MSRDLKVVRSEPSRYLGMRIPGRENSKCKGPEVEVKWLFSRDNKSPHGSQ